MSDHVLAKYIQLVESCLSPGKPAYVPPLSDRLCRTPLWSEVVVRLVLRVHKHCQARVDSVAHGSGGGWRSAS